MMQVVRRRATVSYGAEIPGVRRRNTAFAATPAASNGLERYGKWNGLFGFLHWVDAMMKAMPLEAPSQAARDPFDLTGWSAAIGLLIAAIAVLAGYFAHTGRYITPRTGLGYALGIVGGSLMLILCIYPARKRIPGLRALGSVKGWFRFHMVLGVLGPLLVLYHSNFSLGATNSNVALFCMLIVAGSGLFGVYFYAQIHHGLYGEKATLGELKTAAEALRRSGVHNTVLPDLHDRLAMSEQKLLGLSGRGLAFLTTPIFAAIRYRVENGKVRRYIERRLREVIRKDPLLRRHAKPLRNAAVRYSERRLQAAKRVAEFQPYERIFSFWHLLHLPMFFMMLVSAIVHIVAVHMY
jgi:hypothetical protein